ncbi:MAG: glycerol-3-phosphate 1-O-acyltransferase PlsY [Proteobacteria bacterium]|nr:glycerol-3-phosphate 1-O-acyltransferase PlsY [Pseudomonadota bacterium]
MQELVALLVGYLLGSIPFGLLLAKIGGAGDIRQIGSGNIGATNVLRTGRKGLAAATLVLDGLKGAAAMLLVGHFIGGIDPVLLAALGAMLGHCFPVWLGFKGGKGVATMLGVSLMADWRVGLVCALVWLGTARLSRISSLGGMASAVAAPVAAWALDMPAVAAAFALMAALVVFQHRANIARLRAGTEPRIGQK